MQWSEPINVFPKWAHEPILEEIKLHRGDFSIPRGANAVKEK